MTSLQIHDRSFETSEPMFAATVSDLFKVSGNRNVHQQRIRINFDFERIRRPRRGYMIFGQVQDDVNARNLEENQAYNGNITNLMIWPRVLSQNEIINLAYNCECPVDYVIALTRNRVELFGEAYYSIPDTCPTL
ncbi:neuronal pentraxin-2-like isoform X1 [Clavelina lepadiformis]|uniref:neuronal pentraxin-2-like isoform X1 n=1 Tax=Clavelina lepadiformis TaxID=159417 RepID=UPI004041A903